MNKIELDTEKIEIIEDKEIYIYSDSDKEFIFDVDGACSLKVFHYSYDSNIRIKINLNYENAQVEYHYSTINYHSNNLKMTVEHKNKNTISNVYNHGVNIGNEQLHFEVCGKVGKSESNCICNQENQIINLENGNSTILPILLIDNYDISSSHSAYIGKFKEDIIFYLMSRGISYESATKLLINSLLINESNKSKELSKFIEKINNI